MITSYASVPFSFASSRHPSRFRGLVPLLVLALVCLAGLESRQSVRASCSFDPHKTGVALGGQLSEGQPLAHYVRQDAAEPSADLLHADLSAAFQEPLDDCLAHRAAPLDLVGPLVLVHVAGLPADKRLIGLHLAAEFAERLGLHRQPDSVQHEPRRLLSDAERPAQLAGRNAVLRVGDAPHRDEPLIQAERAILKDRADLTRELFAAVLRLALQHRPAGDDADRFAAALRAGQFAVRPLGREHRLERHGRIGEVGHGFEQGFRGVVVHGLILALSNVFFVDSEDSRFGCLAGSNDQSAELRAGITAAAVTAWAATFAATTARAPTAGPPYLIVHGFHTASSASRIAFNG